VRTFYLNILLIICSTHFSCSSQVWSVQGSPTLAYFVKQSVFTENDLGNYIQTNRETHSPIIGGSLGTSFQFNIGKKLSLRTGINLNYSGTNLKTYISVDYKNSNYWWSNYDFIKIRTFSIGLPLSLIVPFHKGKTTKYFLLGGELNTNVLGRYQQDRVYISEHVQYNDQFKPRVISFGQNYDRDMRRFNFMLSVGIGMSHERFNFDILYFHGLFNVNNSNADPYETFIEIYQKNWRPVCFKLCIGYTFKDKKISNKNETPLTQPTLQR
jgi:hypothetical protein